MFVKRLSANATLPKRATPGSAGYDLSSAQALVIPPYGKGLALTDLSIAIPIGNYGRIAPRSSVGWKSHIDIGCGVIDEDFRFINFCFFFHFHFLGATLESSFSTFRNMNSKLKLEIALRN